MSRLSGTIPAQYVRDVLHLHEAPPPINVRYFYTSPLAIDDPLSPLPPTLTGSAASYRSPPRPFSQYDNVALEKSWIDVRKQLLKHAEWNPGEKTKPRGGKASSQSGSQSGPITSRNPTANSSKGRSLVGSLGSPRAPSSSWQKPQRMPFADGADGVKRTSTELAPAGDSVSVLPRIMDPAHSSLPSEFASTTGNPFIRAPSRSNLREVPQPRSSSRPVPQLTDSYNWGEGETLSGASEERPRQQDPVGANAPELAAKVPVGISRLHNVVFPDLQMEPIYWSPVNDVAPVIRGTWFYADSLLPVEADVANMLEAGYVSLQPWTETWNDELNSAVEVGALGEMKVLHRLWPEPPKNQPSRPSTSRAEGGITQTVGLVESPADDPEKAREEIVATAGDLIDIATGPEGPDNKAAGQTRYGRGGSTRRYLNAAVIYANSMDAYILRPSLQPSKYYGRRPLANYIRKGCSIGIRVVRGFDQDLWDKLHPPKQDLVANKAREGVSTSQAGVSPAERQLHDPTLAMARRPEVTDLVLVIHGIGQKLSEKVESYHFTHAINAFRRDIHVELGTDVVKSHFRPEMGGIMVLPVNWRLNLSLEDGGYREQAADLALNDYSLPDITPQGLPSVRSIVSDVMLDIPYYLSREHGPKMTAAVVKEANRIYRLWCTNNPGFEKSGRVHLIAHSLGSVMAVDILSNQPSHIPHHLKSPSTPFSELPVEHFIFDVTHLFTIGSPCGFFLLLKHANLLPRIDREKAGTDEHKAPTPGVSGEQGTYGCLAVDNVYNVINPYDPIAYHMNACVDAAYASALKPALVPSSSSSLFSFSNPFKSSASTTAALPIAKPSVPRLPSNVELETHDFTREEIAEKRAYLLNDNGQIDWLLRYGGGPLEIQYLTMLGAHSSYWLSRDFVRMLVQEIGRRPGREGTLFAMRAVKKKLAGR